MAKPGWQRRNELARAKGFKNYYDYRAHDYGRRPASEPSFRGAALRRLRGHASRADLLREIRRGRVEIISQVPGRRDPASGQYSEVTLDVQLSDGRTQSYRLRGKQLEGVQIRELRSAVSAAGSDVYTNPSIDVLELIDNELEFEGDPEALAEAIEENYAA